MQRGVEAAQRSNFSKGFKDSEQLPWEGKKRGGVDHKRSTEGGDVSVYV